MHIFLLSISILIAILAQLLFKSFSLSKIEGGGIFLYILNYKLLLGFFLYFISSILYIFSLRKIDLSIAYPAISISYIFIIFLSHFIFGESLGFYKILGSVLIILGVSLIWK